MLRFFGEPWMVGGVSIDQYAEKCPCPEGERCAFCELKFLYDEQGVIMPKVSHGENGASMGSVAYHRRCIGLELLGGEAGG